MLSKRELKRQIAGSEREIEELEKKRMRSQSAIMEANLKNEPPQARDVEYFKTYSDLIALERENLHRLRQELANR